MMKKYFIPVMMMIMMHHHFLSAGNEPAADSKATVISGNTRFTVLTPEMIRMEWNPLGIFEDHASFIFLNRKLDVPLFSVIDAGEKMIIRTGKLVLSYIKNSGKFTQDNLEIQFELNGKTMIWKPGTQDTLNLYGTTRTLDGWNGGNVKNLEPGLISRNGWSFIDDSNNFLFDDSDWPWVMKRPDGDKQDWYFLGYGHDYIKCLSDYVKVAGKIPLPPKFAFGYWWSRYWVYSDSELRELTDHFKKYGIPMDVLIIDMDWHDTYGLTWGEQKKDPFDQPVGWTGYTWNRNLFPEPEVFLEWTGQQKLKTALNLHPASGISPMEEKYEDFAKELGFDTSDKKYIPYELENKNWARVYFNTLLKPFEDKGIDFWWLDWQQWPESKTMKGLSNTWWLNYAFFTNMERSSKRPILFHRWGGLGNHRYQIGFSGDAIVSWESLAFQPFFTATASNVGYGYWSHDIGGHNPLDIPTEGELYLRWIQYGVFSPVLRTHATKSSIMERRFWMFPEYFTQMKDAVQLRYALNPYIYSYARKTYQTGISLCHPMYYEWPEEEKAYHYPGQYYFGDDMILSPVCEPIKENDKLARQTTWLPEGLWYSYFTGELFPGNQEIQGKYALDEIPVFIKAGAIIPLYPDIKNLQDKNDTLVLYITPGGKGEAKIYDDDGNTSGYTCNEYSSITVSSSIQADNKSMLIQINPKEGTYTGAPGALSWELRFPCVIPPVKVSVDGNTYHYSIRNTESHWCYSGKDLMLVIKSPLLSSNSGHTAEVLFDRPLPEQYKICNRKPGEFRRLSQMITDLKYHAGSDFLIPDWLYRLEQTFQRINYHPGNTVEELTSFQQQFDILPREVAGLTTENKAAVQQNIDHLSFTVTQKETDAAKEALQSLKQKESHISIQFPYSPQYSAGGKLALIDGLKASPRYFDGKWQGYQGVDLDFTMDLEDEYDIKQIKAGFLENQGSWIFLPAGMQVYYSADGKEFQLLEAINNPPPVQTQEVTIRRLEVNRAIKARYLRITAKNQGNCPSWHKGAGEKAWLFCDEIEIIKSK